MSTKPQASSSTPASAAPTKQARSRKAANPEASAAGRAGSAGGVVLEKEATKKSPAPSKLATAVSKDAPATSKDAQPKRKPRKLNKDPTPTTPSTSNVSNEAAELEALKNRVRGLEAKVEDLYKSTPTTAPRSPRRRGKGRKTSSATTTATLGNLRSQDQDSRVVDIEDEEADEELGRLEDELSDARRDLALYNPSTQGSQRPRAQRSASQDTEYVEEIPRGAPGVAKPERQVTLSGSYRIPLPATLNPEDVKTIQSGVSAAQNVARSFLDQRRANQALKTAQADAGPPPEPTSRKGAKPETKRSGTQPAESMELSTQMDTGGGKQSWGEWIGGYSMAISRAVKTIEHEAAMEAQSQSQSQSQSSNSRPKTQTKKKRPPPKTTLSGEQVQGLMS